MKSFWVISSRIVAGTRWYWYMGIMEYSMTRALRRFLGFDPFLDRVSWTDPKHWHYDAGTKEFPDDWLEVYQQEEQPPLVNDKTAMVNDMRNHDIFKHSIKNPPREGFKELPEILF